MNGQDVCDSVFVELRDILAVTIISHIEPGQNLNTG